MLNKTIIDFFSKSRTSLLLQLTDPNSRLPVLQRNKSSIYELPSDIWVFPSDDLLCLEIVKLLSLAVLFPILRSRSDMISYHTIASDLLLQQTSSLSIISQETSIPLTS